MPVYCAAKGGVVSFTRSWPSTTVQKACGSIHLPGPNAVAAGKGLLRFRASDLEGTLRKVMLGRFAECDEIANVAAFLVSDAAILCPWGIDPGRWRPNHQLAGAAAVTEVLKGVRVIELGTMITAPLAGMMLADLGAEVIKVEHPQDGDPFRNFRGGLYSPHFVAYNRGKRSVKLDLRSNAGREAFIRLLSRADILIENYRAGSWIGWVWAQRR